MKKGWILILIASFIFFVGCSNTNHELQRNNAELKQQNSLLEIVIHNKEKTIEELQKYKFNHLFINYMENQVPYRFVEKQSSLLALPVEETSSLNIIQENTVITVLDTVNVDETTWNYVSIPVYDTPTNYKGWIKETDSVPYTVDLRGKVQGEVRVLSDKEIFEVETFEEINGVPPVLSTGLERGRIQQRMNGFVYLNCAGGRSIWIHESSIIYPPVDSLEGQ